jgi:ATP-binding cassette subfamily B protein
MLAPLLFMLWFELPVGHGLAALGRRLEIKLRLAYQTKLPRLGARYFRTRLLSDLTERAHALHHVRRLPELAARALRAAFGLCLTASAIAWLDLRAGAVSCGVVLLTLAVTLLFQPVLGERDLRKRTYEGALMRFYLDALRGLTAVHSHGAADALATEHEALLVDWTRAGLASGRAAVAADATVALLGALGCISLVALDVHDSGVTTRTALLAFWALQLPAMASDLVLAARMYPLVRNATLRMLELLVAPDEHPPMHDAITAPTARTSTCSGVALEFRHMTVALNRRPVLQDITSRVAPGTHVAIVGASGAGKSTVLATLLGWHHVAPDSLMVDAAPLDAEARQQLRADTVWVDPSVQLWNESLLDNLCYGAREHAHASIARAMDDAELHTALQGLPSGMQSSLGEGGGLLSGGEGQRVRLARALLRTPPRLVLLDEAMRGLDRSKRARLLKRLRERFRDATLLCVTHDVAETRDFDRIWVLDQGKLVEDAPPAVLLQDSNSQYSALLRAEQNLTQRAWQEQGFRQVRLVAGRLDEVSTHGEHG